MLQDLFLIVISRCQNVKKIRLEASGWYNAVTFFEDWLESDIDELRLRK